MPTIGAPHTLALITASRAVERYRVFCKGLYRMVFVVTDTGYDPAATVAGVMGVSVPLLGLIVYCETLLLSIFAT